jgi:hypothetical protein
MARCSNCRRVFEAKPKAGAHETKDAIIGEMREEFLQHTCQDTIQVKGESG